MRTLIVHSGNMYGGIERVLETMARSSRLRADIDPQFALCFEGRLADSLRQLGVPPDILGPVRVTRPDQVFRARTRLAALLRRHPVDVIVTQSPWSHALFASVARRFNTPLVMWVHDILSGKSWLEKLAKRHRPDLMICNSFYSQHAAAALFPATPSTMIRCPLAFDDGPDTRPDVRRLQGAPVETTVIISVARMEPYKGHHVLIEALARLETARPWACWIVGGAQRPFERAYERSLIEAVNARGLQDRVTFLGQRQDVGALLGAADVFCHPAQGAEPFGLAMVEALHAGLPVVASGLGGPQEIVTESCGRWVPAGDPEALAGALSSLLNDPASRRAMAAAATARATELCDPVARLSELSATFERLVLRTAA